MYICVYVYIYKYILKQTYTWASEHNLKQQILPQFHYTHTQTHSHTQVSHTHTHFVPIQFSPPLLPHILYTFSKGHRTANSNTKIYNFLFSVFCFRFFYNFCFFYNFLSQHFQCWPAQLCRCSWTPFSKKNVYLNACLQRHGAVIFDTPVEVPYCTEIMKKGGWKHDDVPQLLKHTYKKNTYGNRNTNKMSEKGNFFFWRVDSYRDWVRILQREYGIVVICQVSFAKREPCNNRALLHMRPSKLGSLWTIALY